MSKREKVSGEIVRAVILRPPQFIRDVVPALNHPQSLMVQRPSDSNFGSDAWQFVGGRFYEDEAIDAQSLAGAMRRVLREEVGITTDAELVRLDDSQFGEWLSRMFLLNLPEDPGALNVDLKRNLAVKWFNTSHKDTLVTERRASTRGRRILERHEIAFDHTQITNDALKRLRDSQ